MDIGSAVSLLPATFDYEHSYDPQDLFAVDHTQFIVEGLKTSNVHSSFAQSYSWTFRVANVPYGILGCESLSCHGFQIDVRNKCLIESEGSIFDDPHDLILEAQLSHRRLKSNRHSIANITSSFCPSHSPNTHG